MATIYQVIDDAARYDVGTRAHARHEDSADATLVLERSIGEHGKPQDLLSDNSLAFNQLRQRITRYRAHYNNRRPDQTLVHVAPRVAWEFLAHMPAAEPTPLAILEGKASQYRQVRRLR